jgi:signal transduction histidine kinase
MIGVLTLCYRTNRTHNQKAAALLEVFAAPLAEILDRKENEEALRREVAAKDEWTAFLSHEIRGPLTSL